MGMDNQLYTFVALFAVKGSVLQKLLWSPRTFVELVTKIRPAFTIA